MISAAAELVAELGPSFVARGDKKDEGGLAA
jgi:hypothetical protein